MDEKTPHICDDNCHHYKPFINVHCHTSWSLLDGCASIKGYIQKAKEFNHPGIVVTDHGTAAAWFDFYRDVTKAGLKPVLGCEYYFTTNLDAKVPSRKRPLEERDKHQTILIKSKEGYKNACRLNFMSYTGGFYYKPRISYEQLFQYKEGLLVTSGCMASMFNQFVANDQHEEAEKWFKRFVEEFGEDFYGEIQLNEIVDKNTYGISQKDCNKFILDMCKKYSVPHLIGGDTHYVEKEDKELQNVVLNINSRRSAKDITENKESFIHARKLYYHNSDDYYTFNKEHGYGYDEKEIIDQAFENSLKVLDKVDFKFDTGKINFPKFVHPTIKDKTNLEIIKEMADDGLLYKLRQRKKQGEKFSNELIDEYNKRIEYELEVIDQKQITDYFLIVQDVINWAQKQGFQMGVGRGSVGGSLVAYAIGITEIDPIKFGLYFERFQNPERKSLPDIDVDSANGAREHIRTYLEERYGKESVFGVVTFHLFHAKSALQDASRGLGKESHQDSVLRMEIPTLAVDPNFIKKIEASASLRKEIQDDIVDIWGDSSVPANWDNMKVFKPYIMGGTGGWREDLEEFEHALEHTKDLPLFFAIMRAQPGTSPTVLQWIEENKDTIKWGQKLMGQVKNLGTHAGGILITPGPVYDYIPVARGGKEVVTAFKEADGSTKDLSELGLLKLDILGLRTLNIIGNCLQQVKEDLGKDISNDVTFVNLENPKFYEELNRGNVYGIFQFDGGAVDLMRMIKPDCFNDLVAINALNRPGPKETFGPLYGKWKRYHQAGTPELCSEDDAYPRLEFMREMTKETYYTLCYQEQFMMMVVEAAGFNMGEADDFRRMIAWRKDNAKYYLVEKYFVRLEEGMKSKGYSQEDVDYFVDYCRKFLGYSFNKAHSAAYAYTAAQTLYLKTYYPAYFFANLLNYETQDNYQSIIADALLNGVETLPPAINKSKSQFAVEGNKIRIGLTAIKGCGDKALAELETLEINKCKTLDEVLAKPFKAVKGKVLEVLVNAGTFDELGIDRTKIVTAYALYKDKKIATWFTRKRKALDITTMPPSLLEFPEHIVMAMIEEHKSKETPWIPFVTSLIPHIKAKKALTEAKKDELFEELLGISLSTAKKLSKLLAAAAGFAELDLKSIATRSTDNDLCYWFLKEVHKKNTKTGKPYLTLAITDGSMSVMAKCWQVANFKRGSSYISQLKKDKFGYTVVQNNNLQEIPLDDDNT